MLSKNEEKQIANLPVYKFQDDIISQINKNKFTLIIGETGSGKTTQIPKIIYNKLSPEKLICITQPRRVAAISLAKRVSEEMNSTIGNLIGYSVRFQEKMSKNTKIKFVTDGMLVRECILDPLLKKYSYIILDEVHERSIHTDLLMFIIKHLIESKKREDLKVIIMSATINPKKFLTYFNTNSCIFIQGRTFPVEIYNVVKDNTNYIDMALTCILQILVDKNYPFGDILVFLPGQEDIEDLQELLYSKRNKIDKEYSNNIKFEVLPLFSSLPYNQQMKVFLPNNNGKRKIILATNIAETSITIKNVKYIVDTGLFKKRKFIHQMNIDSLTITNISKNSAKQRSGRAGRESEGYCFRLYSEDKYSSFLEENEPEILRINLRNIILELIEMGYSDLNEIDFFDKPKKENFAFANEELISYGALTKSLHITELGKNMVTFPVEPNLALILVNSLKPEYSEIVMDIVKIVSLLQTDNILYTPSMKKEEIEKTREKFINPISDHLTLLNIYSLWEESENKEKFSKDNFLNDRALRKAKEIFLQLLKYMNSVKSREISEKEDGIMEEKLKETENYLQKIEEEKLLSREDYTNKENKRQELIIQCLLSGMFNNMAKYSNDDNFITIKGNKLCRIHPSSILMKNRKKVREAGFLFYNEIIITSKEYLKCCTLINEEMAMKYINKSKMI